MAKIGKSQPIMFSFCAKTCSNHDRGNMSMTITFVFTLTATSSVKHCIFVVQCFLRCFQEFDHHAPSLLSAPNTFVLLSSVVKLCSHLLFTDNIHHLIPGLVPVPAISSLTRDSSGFFCYFEFAK